MTHQDLYARIVQQRNISAVHPLHKAILEECCENALANEQSVTDEVQLQYAVHVAFLTSFQVMKGIVRGSLETAHADQATLQYRGQTFLIPANSILLAS